MVNPSTGQIIDAEAYESVNAPTPESSFSEYADIHTVPGKTKVKR